MSRLPALGRRGEGWVAIQGVLLLAAIAAGIAGPAWDGVARLVTTLGGATCAFVGGLLAWRGMRDLSDSLTPLPHPRAGASLVETGSYRLVRHPIYGGIVIGAAGYGFVTASPAALATAALLLGFFRLKSAREEAWLVERYPSYPAYRARTRRLIPFIY